MSFAALLLPHNGPAPLPVVSGRWGVPRPLEWQIDQGRLHFCPFQVGLKWSPRFGLALCTGGGTSSGVHLVHRGPARVQRGQEVASRTPN